MVGRIVMWVRSRLQVKAALAVLMPLSIILAVFTYFDVQEQRSAQEEALLEKGRILALTGAQTVSSILEQAISSGRLTSEQVFDTNYQPIPGTNPQKYHTAYDSFTDQTLLRVEDEFLKDDTVVFAVAVDQNGYLPTHNTKYSQSDDSSVNRTKRIFDDEVGLKAARNTASFLQQVYHRDTGEVMWDLSVPITVGGKHWGAFRVGLSIQQIQSAVAGTTWQIIFSMLGVLAVIALVVWFVTRQSAKPVAEMAKRAAQIGNVDLANLAAELDATAKGDLTRTLTIETAEVPVRSKDETGQMAESFNLMVRKLRETGQAFSRMNGVLRQLVAQVVENAARVDQSSRALSQVAEQAGAVTQQIASSIQEVAKGTQDQSSSVHQTVACVEQLSKAIGAIASGAQEQARGTQHASKSLGHISGVIDQVAANSLAVASVADSTSLAARRGTAAVDKVAQGMAVIKETVTEAADRIGELGNRSEEIGNIVETIDDIAEQTNLLALNAAIEAARAGKHGKGFAVVADEVRKLAERSSEATKEIATLIQTVQRDTADAVRAMGDGVQGVERGSMLTEEAGQALQEILVAAETTADKVREILTAAQEMAAVRAEVVQAMDSVSAIAEENAAATEEMKAGSNEVIRSVESIAAVSQENGAAAEEVTAAAQEMAAHVGQVVASANTLWQMAQMLRESAAQFKASSSGELDVDEQLELLDVFRRAHLNWVKRCEAVLTGKESIDVEQASSHTDCALGKWYSGRGAIEFGHFPEYHLIDQPHQAFHQSVAAFVDACNRGAPEAIRATIAEVRQQSAAVVARLDELERRIRGKSTSGKRPGDEIVYRRRKEDWASGHATRLSTR